MNTLGMTTSRLRALRALSQPALAQRVGVSEDWLRHLETGKLPQMEHHLEHLRALVVALGYSLVGFRREAGMIEPEDIVLSGDPGLREIGASYSQLDQNERPVVDDLLRALGKRAGKSA